MAFNSVVKKRLVRVLITDPLHGQELEKALQILRVRQSLITVVTLCNINGNLVVNG